MNKFLIAGLGNIGQEYASTRHNIGFDVVEAFVQKHEAVFTPGRLADVAEIKWRGKWILCIKPTTFMNLSGKSVKYWIDKEKIPQENILVIVDELALSLNKIRLRGTGSSGGHNGLKSIEEYLETNKYPKLRFGIGNDFPKGRQVEYVLGKWNETELPVVKLKILKCVELIENFVQSGIEITMNQFNNLNFNL
ncbi:MAG: aminoacyl-tRNA hydrolase [Chitinophagaceae bacterium]